MCYFEVIFFIMKGGMVMADANNVARMTAARNAQQKHTMAYFHEYMFYRLCNREMFLQKKQGVMPMAEANAKRREIAEYAYSHNMASRNVYPNRNDQRAYDETLRNMRTEDLFEAMSAVFSPKAGKPYFQRLPGNVSGRENPSFLNDENVCRMINGFYYATNVNIGQQKGGSLGANAINSGQLVSPLIQIKSVNDLGHNFITYVKENCYLPITLYDTRFFGSVGSTVDSPLRRVWLHSAYRSPDGFVDLTQDFKTLKKDVASIKQAEGKRSAQTNVGQPNMTAVATGFNSVSQPQNVKPQPQNVKQNVVSANANYSVAARSATNNNNTFDKVGQVKDDNPLSRLRQYMTDKEYSKIRAKFVFDEAGKPINDIPHIDYAIGFLDYLRDNGVEFTLDTDKYNGQIKCCFGNRTNIRIVDASNVANNSERYIGRAQVGGSSFYYIVRGKDRDFIPDTNMMISLYRYVNGESVPTLDGRNTIGVNRVLSYKNNPTAKRNSSYWMPPSNDESSSRKSSAFSADAGFYQLDNTDKRRFFIYKSEDNSTSDVTNKIEANEYLTKAVQSARKNFYDALDLSSIIDEAKLHKDDVYHDYDLNPNSQISIIQREYINLIKGNITSLPLSEGEDISLNDYASVDDAIIAHAQAVTNEMIGFYPIDRGQFNPGNVATFMNSDFGVYQNADEIVNALRILDYPASALKTSDSNFYNKTFVDKLVKYNSETAYPMSQGSPFIKHMYDKMKATFEQTGCEPVGPNDIMIDDNGVVQYRVQQNVGLSKRSLRTIEGTIGQIFEPDAMGLVTTKFAGRGDNNYMFAPGYQAYVMPQKEGEHLSMEERTRLKGYEQSMIEAVGKQIRRDVLGVEGPLGFGSPTSLNNVYSHLYDERYPVDYLDYMQSTPEQRAFTETRIYTATRKVRYPTSYRDESTLNAEWRKEHGMRNDKGEVRDLYELTGTNMAIIDKTSNGFFDPTATSTGNNQGIVRYLADGAKVGLDGKITPCDSDSPQARCALMRHPFFKNSIKHDPSDRNAMATNNAMVALNAGRVNMAFMSLAGLGFDDGFVVSKKFADLYHLPSSDGDGRSLVIGDKASDFHGDKGVIAKIISPDWTEEDAKNARVPYDVVKLFRMNPDLQAVGSPYAPISRFNGGTARDAMENPKPLYMPDGKVLDGCLVQIPMMILPQIADEKTHIYGRDEQMVNKGRRISGQFAWAMQSKGATNLAHEVYGPNVRALTDVREYLLVEGLDIDAAGNVVVGYHPHGDEQRMVHKLPSVENMLSEVTVRATNDAPERIVHKFSPYNDNFDLREQFMNDMGRSGGFMALPFPLDFNSGQPTQKSEDGYLLPLMSADLRSGQDFSEDTSGSVHAYTRNYMYIYENACKYQYLDYLKKNKEYYNFYSDDKAIEDAQEKLVRDSQDRFDTIANDVKSSRIDTKDNVFKELIMARRMPDSATAVWTADPSLDIDQIAMNTEMAKTLGCVPEHGGYKRVLVWRDPILHDSNVRYMRVVIDDNLTGVSINPAMDKPFDGDFDGDTVGLYAPKTKAAQEECFDKFSPAANLLNYGVVDEDGKHPLNYHVDGLDLSAAMANNPSLAQKQKVVRDAANALDEKFHNGEITEHERALAGQRLLENNQSDITRQAFEESLGVHVLSFKDMTSHFKSLETFVKDGAKGSMKKLKEYAEYVGAELDIEDDTDTIVGVKDLGNATITRDDLIETQKATAVKTCGTGVAGSYSHRCVTVLRNKDMQAALEVTYPNTQAILQAKHDARDAMHKYDVLMSSARALWRGEKLERIESDDGVTFQSLKIPGRKEPVRMKTEDFVKSFCEIYDDLGVSYNPEHVNRIASILTDSKTGYIMNLEGEARDTFADLLDKSAYVHSFDDLVLAAKMGKCNDLFANNSLFMPDVVRKNRQALESGGNIIPIMRMDTKTPDMRRREAEARFELQKQKNADKASVKSDESVKANDVSVSQPIVVDVTRPVVETNVQKDKPTRQVSVKKSADWFNKGRETVQRQLAHDGSTLSVDVKAIEEEARKVAMSTSDKTSPKD